MAVLMQGLRLTAGATVLDFGAGTGWFARFLHTARLRDPAGRRQRPSPWRGLYGGSQSSEPPGAGVPAVRRPNDPAADASVDRVLGSCVSSHAESGRDPPGLRRILKPGGIAASRSQGAPLANPGVAVRDAQLPGRGERRGRHALWRAARRSAFVSATGGVPRPAVPPLARSLRGSARRRAGHRALADRHARVPERRTFSLLTGTERLDSRRARTSRATSAPAVSRWFDRLADRHRRPRDQWHGHLAAMGHRSWRRGLRRAPRCGGRCWSSTPASRQSANQRGRSRPTRPCHHPGDTAARRYVTVELDASRRTSLVRAARLAPGA